jgi:hypothetical protein
MRTMVAAAACVTGLLTVNAEATLIGKTLEATYYYPDITTPYAYASFAAQSFVVAPGVDTIGTVEGVTTLLTDFRGDQLIITFNTGLSSPSWNATPFNGVFFTLRTPGTLDIASAVVDPASTLLGFDNARLSFSNQAIGLDWNGLAYLDGQQIVVNFTFNQAAVPEPSMLAFALAGMLGLVFVGNRRRK